MKTMKLKTAWQMNLGHVTLLGPIRAFKINNGHVTQLGKKNWPIGGFAILYTALSLYEIIKWHHTHRNSLYKQGKLGRTVLDTIGTTVSGFPVLLFKMDYILIIFGKQSEMQFQSLMHEKHCKSIEQFLKLIDSKLDHEISRCNIYSLGKAKMTMVEIADKLMWWLCDMAEFYNLI